MRNHGHPPPDQFPEQVQFKSCIAKIYRVRHRKRLRYEVRHHDTDGALQRATFEHYDGAKGHAETIVRQLAKGGLDMIALRGRDRFVYENGVVRLHPLGVSLDDAAARYAEAIKILGGAGTLREAVAFFVKHHSANLPQIKVRDVLDEFLTHKVNDVEVSAVYLRDLRNRLGRFAEAFQCPIAAITQKDIVRYLRSLGVTKRTRINHRRNIGTLVNYAKEQGYLVA